MIFFMPHLIRAIRTIRTRDLLLYGAIYVGVFLGHLFNVVGSEGIYFFSDSDVYYRKSRLPLTNGFFSDSRPPVILLFFTLFATYTYTYDIKHYYSYISDAGLLYSQTLFSLAAFSFLAFACAKTARTSKGRFILFAFPLLFSLTPLVARWNFAALSDSLSISLFVVFVALWIFYFFFKRLSYLLGIAIVSLLWAGTRDTNAYLLIMIAIVIMIVIIAGVVKKWKGIGIPSSLPHLPLTALCIYFGGVFALSDFSAEQGNRWLFPFYNSVAQRILPIPKYVAYFSDRGMPVSPALMERTGKWASSDDWAFYGDPRLWEFRDWTANRGKMTYIKFLMSHPIYLITAPALDFQNNFLVEVGYVVNLHFKSAIVPLPPRLSAIVLYLLLFSYGVTALLAFILYWRRSLHESPYLAVPLVMVLLSVPHAWLAYHGDAMEVVRHSLATVVQFLLGVVLSWLYMWDHSTRRNA